MDSPLGTLPLQYIRLIGEQLAGMGVDVARWLAESGRSGAWLRDVRSTLDFDGFRTLVHNAVSMSNEEAMGLLVGERLTVTTHGLLGYAVQSSATVQQTVEVFERFVGLRAPFLKVSSGQRAGFFRMRFDEALPLLDVRRPVLEAVVLSVKNVLDAVSLGACKVERVSFPFPAPAYAPLASAMFGCEVSYGQSFAGIVLRADVLHLRLRMSDPQAFAEAAAFCEAELDKLHEKESLSARVRRLLLEKQNGFPSLQVTARLCHLTARTLHRRLEDEGTSYRELLEDVRHTLAVEYLRAGRFSIEEIAYTLGYNDVANFRRAFKRWEHVPPSVHRATQTSRTTPKRW
jgi:AraC-like DNA-binding protein